MPVAHDIVAYPVLVGGSAAARDPGGLQVSVGVQPGRHWQFDVLMTAYCMGSLVLMQAVYEFKF